MIARIKAWLRPHCARDDDARHQAVLALMEQSGESLDRAIQVALDVRVLHTKRITPNPISRYNRRRR